MQTLLLGQAAKPHDSVTNELVSSEHESSSCLGGTTTITKSCSGEEKASSGCLEDD